MSGYRGLFIRTRIPEPPYRCGFFPEAHTYGEYVNHIGMCDDPDCRRRFVNHMLLQSYFARKYGAESGTIAANDPKLLGELDHDRPSTARPVSSSKATPGVGTDRTGIRLKDDRSIARH